MYGADATNRMCSRWPKCSLGSTVNRNSRTGGSSASVSAWSADGTSRTRRRQAQNDAKMPATTQAVNQKVASPGSTFAVRTGRAWEDESERQVLVDHVDVQPLAIHPAARDVEDGGDVVVYGRKEVARQPDDRQDNQRHQQEALDTRRNSRRLSRHGWQGAAKIS